MIRLAWLNRFLSLFVFVVFLFVMIAGSVILNENRLNSPQSSQHLVVIQPPTKFEDSQAKTLATPNAKHLLPTSESMVALSSQPLNPEKNLQANQYPTNQKHSAPSPKYLPAPASTSLRTQEAYYRIDGLQKQQGLLSTQPSNNSANDRRGFDYGYRWAAQHRVFDINQCKTLARDSINGCISYLEVSHYVNSTQKNLDL